MQTTFKEANQACCPVCQNKIDPSYVYPTCFKCNLVWHQCFVVKRLANLTIHIFEHRTNIYKGSDLHPFIKLLVSLPLDITEERLKTLLTFI
jgi:hypothetical protein